METDEGAFHLPQAATLVGSRNIWLSLGFPLDSFPAPKPPSQRRCQLRCRPILRTEPGPVCSAQLLTGPQEGAAVLPKSWRALQIVDPIDAKPARRNRSEEYVAVRRQRAARM